MNIKVLQVIDSLEIGGAEKVVADLTNLLYDSGLEVEVMILVNRGKVQENIKPNIRVHFLERKMRWSFFKMYRFSQIARNFEVVHVHLRHNLKYVFLCKRIFPFKARLVFHDHFGDININNSTDLILKQILKNIFYVGPSRQICEWAAETIGIKKNRIFFLPNIILKEELKRYDRNLSMKNKKLVLISNFRRTKNITFGVELVKQLHKSDKNFSLDIIGQPMDEDYVMEIKELINKYNLLNSISLVHNCGNPNKILKNYTMAIHTSISETGPLVLWEYISQALPFLSYDTGEVVNIIRNDFPDFIIDCFDVKAWEIKVEKILSLDYVILENKMNLLFNTYCSKENYVQKFLNIYNKAVNF